MQLREMQPLGGFIGCLLQFLFFLRNPLLLIGAFPSSTANYKKSVSALHDSTETIVFSLRYTQPRPSPHPK